MSKALLVLLSVCLAGSLYWNSRQGETLRKLQTELGQRQEQLNKTENALTQEKRRNEQALSVEAQKEQELRTRLKAQKELADAARQRLFDARANLREADAPEDLRQNLRQEKVYVDELEARLKAVHQAESETSAQGKLSQNQRRWQKDQSDADLNLQIQAQQKLVQETEDKIKGLVGRRDFLGKEALQDAHKELQTRKSALQELKDRKKNVDQAWNTDGRLNQSEIQAQLGKLKQSEGQIRQLLQQEHARYESMKKELDSRQRSRQSQLDGITQLEADFQAQQAKLIELQTALKEQEHGLEEISR